MFQLSVIGGFALLASSCRRDTAPTFGARPAAKTGSTVIHAPAKATSVESGNLDGLGRPIRVACVTCHALRDGGAFAGQSSDLREFHVGLVVEHGKLQCGSCHVLRGGGEPRLHLADGAELSTADAMQLCAQCHGPKYQTYLHGGHGGMTGHWDLSRGDRTRNHCIDCHDPHVPKFQPVHPVLPPRDRLVTPQAEAAPGEHQHG
jgi:hypothetical protein